MSLFIFLMLTSGVSMHAMDLSTEQREAAKNWFAADQDANQKWLEFDKISADLQYERGKMVDDAFGNALQSKEFDDFVKAKTLEIGLRQKLCKGSPETYRKRELVGMQSCNPHQDEFDKFYGTCGISTD